MCAIEDARELRRKRVYRNSLKLMIEINQGNNDTKARARRIELANEITRLNDEIFVLEEKLGLAHQG